jgi:TRAP-type C4-dicarboxylate transport system permease small subunit
MCNLIHGFKGFYYLATLACLIMLAFCLFILFFSTHHSSYDFSRHHHIPTLLLFILAFWFCFLLLHGYYSTLAKRLLYIQSSLSTNLSLYTKFSFVFLSSSMNIGVSSREGFWLYLILAADYT